MASTCEAGRNEPAAAATLASSLDDPDALGLEAIGNLLSTPPPILNRARDLFTLLGDPGRRTILERLSRQPERAGRSLPDVTGMEPGDIYHRLRSLLHGRVIVKNRHYIYSVDPAALNCASRYIDTLTAGASLTALSQPR